ncbi:MAG: ornithine cyclodeaminase family protein [Pseudomonadota bacterium]
MSLDNIIMMDAQRIDALLDYPSLVHALYDAHRLDEGQASRDILSRPRGGGEEQQAPNDFLVLPAWQGNELGLKAVTVFPGNQAPHPSVHALYLLFDGTHGKPLAILDGTAMTPWKTAADSALGSRLLAREDSRELLVLGAGTMAPHLVQAHLAVRPTIKQVGLWNRTPERAQALVDQLTPEVAAQGISIQTIRNLEEATRTADIISCCTAARGPLIQGDWLKPGCHLDLVGSFTEEMRECDDQAVRRAILYVDYDRFTPDECGDLCQPLAEGVITKEDIIGDLFDLCQGKVLARVSTEAITLFKNGGGGHLDLMTARHLMARANDPN